MRHFFVSISIDVRDQILKAKRKSLSFIEISDGEAFKLTEC